MKKIKNISISLTIMSILCLTPATGIYGQKYFKAKQTGEQTTGLQNAKSKTVFEIISISNDSVKFKTSAETKFYSLALISGNTVVEGRFFSNLEQSVRWSNGATFWAGSSMQLPAAHGSGAMTLPKGTVMKIFSFDVPKNFKPDKIRIVIDGSNEKVYKISDLPLKTNIPQTNIPQTNIPQTDIPQTDILQTDIPANPEQKMTKEPSDPGYKPQSDKKSGTVNVVDKTGKPVFQFKYTTANMRYYFNKDGELENPTFNYSEGLLGVCLDGKCGYIDLYGNEVVPLKYDGVSSFSTGRGRVELNGKYGFIDRYGEELIPLKYNKASDFSKEKGSASVELNGIKFNIDKSGNIVE